MTASIFAKARESMVVSQLQPAGITSAQVLNAYLSVPREKFVPVALQNISYLDETLDLGNGRVLLEPLLHGLMVEELKIESSERVLDLGDTTGYSAAILQSLGAVVSGELSQTAESFDAILLNGAASFIPDDLMAQLKVGGRLACILQPESHKVGKIVVLTKESGGIVSKQVFEDAKAVYLAGLEPKAAFIF